MDDYQRPSLTYRQFGHFLKNISSHCSGDLLEINLSQALEQLFDHISSPALMMDLSSGNIIFINNIFSEHFLISKENVVGRTLVDLNLWHSLELFITPGQDGGNKRERLIMRLRSRNGITKPYNLTNGIVLSNNDRFLYCVLEPLQESSLITELGGKFPELANVSMHGVFIVQNNKHIYFNDRFANILGMAADDIYARSPQQIIAEVAYPEYRHITLSSYKEFQGGRAASGNVEIKIRNGRGEDRWVEIHSHAHQYNDCPAVLGVVIDITEAKTAIEQVKSGEQLLQTIQDSVQDSIFIKDHELKYVHVNQQMKLLFGMEANELIGLTDADLFEPEAAAHIKIVDERVLSGEVVDEEHTKAVKGEDHTFHVIKTPIRNAKGDITGLCGIARDITEKKLAESRLRESEYRLRAIIENTNDFICSYIPDGTITYASPQCRHFGYEPEEIAGKKVFEYIHPNDIELMVKALQQTLLTGREAPVIFRLIGKDGRIHYVEERSRLLREGEKIVQFSSVIRDITEQRKAEQALRESEARYRQLVETMNDGLGAVDVEGKITYVNNSLCKILGYSQNEVIGKHLSGFLDEENRQRIEAQLVRRQKGERGNYELTWIAKDGRKKHTAMSSVPLYDKQNNFCGSFALMTDITERKRISRELEQAHFEINQMFQAAPPMIVIGKDHTILKINDTYRQTYEIDTDQIINHKCYDNYPGPLCNSSECPIQKIMSGSEQYDYEDVTSLANGKKIHSIVSARPYHNSEGAIIGIVESFTDITSLKHAEQALRESEEKFREIAQLAPEGIYEMNNEGIIEFANKQALKYFGYDKDILETEVNALDIISPKDRDRASANICRLLAGERIASNEYEVKRLDGSTFMASLHSAPIIRDGKVSGARGVIVDITERKKAEEALAASEMINRAVIEKSPLGVSVRSRTGKLLMCNKAWQEIWGKSAEEIEEYINEDDRTVLKFDHRDDYLKLWHKQIRKIYEEGGYFSVPEARLRYYRKGGDHWVSQHFYAIRDGQGEVDRVVILTEDITERKRALDALKQSEEYYRGLFESAHDAIFVLEPENEIILDVNSRACEIYGFSKTELVGMSLERISKNVPEGKKQIRQIIEKKFYHSFETTHFRKDGSEMLLDINASLIDYKGRPAILSINRDITQKRQAEANLRDNEERLRTIIDSAPITIFAINSDGIVTFIEGKQLSLVGLDRQQLVGRSIFDLNLNLASNFPQLLTMALAGKLSLYYLELANRIFEVRLSVQYNMADEPSGLIGTATDITDRRRAEEALEQSESWLRTIVAESKLTLFALDRHGVVTYVEGNFMERQTGLSKDFLTGQSVFGLFLNEAQRPLLEHAMAGKLNSYVTEFKGRVFEARFYPQVDREGDVIGIYGVAIDITDQKNIENALREGEEKYRLLIENAGQPIFSVDYEGTFLTMNSTAAEYLGGSVGDFTGRKMHELFPKKIADMQLKSVQKAIDSGRKVVTERPTILMGEERWFITNIQPIRDADSKMSSALLVANDITQRKRLETREIAKSKFLDDLRKARTINESLRLCCRTIGEAKIFKAAIMALYDEKLAISNYDQVGFNKERVDKILAGNGPDDESSKRSEIQKLPISHSCYIPAKSIAIDRKRRDISGTDEDLLQDRPWHRGDTFYAMLLDDDEVQIGWLTADMPFTGRVPSVDDVVFIEELMDIAGKKVKEIRYLELLESERLALQEKNITLREVLAHIEEEKMEIKNQIAEEVENILIPMAKKVVKADGNINMSLHNVLLNGLESLAVPDGTRHLYSKLSPREIEICNLIKIGASSKDIADELHISLATVQKHRESIRRKLKITNKSINLMTYLKG